MEPKLLKNKYRYALLYAIVYFILSIIIFFIVNYFNPSNSLRQIIMYSTLISVLMFFMFLLKHRLLRKAVENNNIFK